MNGLFFSLLLLLLISFDGFVLGFLFGVKKIKIPLSIIILISTFTGFVVFFAMGIGRLLGDVVSADSLSYFAGFLMIALGIYNLFNELPLYKRSFFVMIALLMNVDSFGYGLQVGLANQPFWLAPLSGFFVGSTLVSGVIYGHITKNKLLIQSIESLPGLLFIFLGVSKILF